MTTNDIRYMKYVLLCNVCMHLFSKPYTSLISLQTETRASTIHIRWIVVVEITKKFWFVRTQVISRISNECDMFYTF